MRRYYDQFFGSLGTFNITDLCGFDAKLSINCICVGAFARMSTLAWSYLLVNLNIYYYLDFCCAC